jgi:putative endonuclease
MERQPCVYLLAKASHSTFYTGVTSDLHGRIWQHRTEAFGGFTARYGIKRLVWFEAHETMEAAIHREKQIKRWARQWKYELVNSVNPTCGTWPRISVFHRSLRLGRRTPGQARGDWVGNG